MRKLTLLLAVLALAATSSVADAAKKSKKAAPAAAKQEMPGEPGGRVIAGYFREVGKIGQPQQTSAAKKGKKK